MIKYIDEQDFMTKNGFNKEGITYSVFGDNTYSIKDKLKELGFVYSPILKWHTSAKVELPEGYTYVEFNYNDLYNWYELEKTAYMYEEAETLVRNAFDAAYPKTDTEWIGSIKERLRNLTVTFEGGRSFEGRYGHTNIYTFKHDKNILVWFTASANLTFEEGTPLILTGTVVEFQEYKGNKITKVNRCIVKPL